MTAARDHRARMRRVATAAAVAILLGAVGCAGSDGGDKDKAQSATAAGATDRPKTPREHRAEEITYQQAVQLSAEDNVVIVDPQGATADMAEALQDLQVGIAEANGESACHELSDAGKLAVARSAGGTSPKDCGSVVERVGEERRRLRQKSALSRLLSARVRGHEGTARVLYPDGKIHYIPFVKIQGLVWKVTSLDLVDPVVIDSDPEGPGSDYSDPRGGGARGQIKEVLYDVEGDFPLALGNSVCFELSPAGQREVERSGISKGSCQQRIQKVARRALALGYQPRFSEFRSMEINGNRATAVTKSPGRKALRVPFVRTDEGWKLPSLRYAGVDLDKLRPLPPLPSGDGDGLREPDTGDPSGGGPKQAITEVISDIQNDFAAGIGWVCSELSKGGERELARHTRPADCTTVASRLSRQLRKAKVPLWFSHVLSINVRGKHATALLQTEGRGGGTHRARFVREHLRGWRLTSLRYAEPIRGWLDRPER